MVYTLQSNKWMLAHDLGSPLGEALRHYWDYSYCLRHFHEALQVRPDMMVNTANCKHQREEIDLSFGNLEKSSKLISMANYKPVSTGYNGTNSVVVTDLPSLGCVFWRILHEKHWLSFFLTRSLWNEQQKYSGYMWAVCSYKKFEDKLIC